MSINHEIIQAYLEQLYSFAYMDLHYLQNNNNLYAHQNINKSYSQNEIYGELYYYSMVKLLDHLDITTKDHFLDLGSGCGKIVFQVLLTTSAASIIGIEINNNRFIISSKIKDMITKQLPEIFNNNKNLQLIHGDFLKQNFDNITIIYVCCTIFSIELLHAIEKKINNMPNVQKVISFKQLPNLSHFTLKKKIFVHGDWDYAMCYLYIRKNC